MIDTSVINGLMLGCFNTNIRYVNMHVPADMGDHSTTVTGDPDGSVELRIILCYEAGKYWPRFAFHSGSGGVLGNVGGLVNVLTPREPFSDRV